MFWLLYEVLFFAGLAFMAPYYLWRMRRRGGYARGFGERFGIYKREVREKLKKLSRPVWIHAVSVGEVQLAFSLIEQLKKNFPGLELILSTTTSTGYAIAKEKEGPGLAVIYYPMDSRLFFQRVHRFARPRALLVMEAELWPNHLLFCRCRGVLLGLINARMSECSFRRYLRFKLLFGPVLSAFELITLQCEADRQRLIELGANPEKLVVIGSLKYGAASATDEMKRKKLLEDLGFLRGKPVLVGASTHSGEEAVLLETWQELKKIYPDLALVLAPRHVERKKELADLLNGRHVPFVCRSSPLPGCDVVLLDTTGDLRYVYELASVVFVGKSLCARGGQNLMEPAWYGKAIVFGPNMQNFRPIVEDFLNSKAAVQVASPEELRPAIEILLNGAGDELGRRAKSLVDSKQDVLEKTVEAMKKNLELRTRNPELRTQNVEDCG